MITIYNHINKKIIFGECVYAPIIMQRTMTVIFVSIIIILAYFIYNLDVSNVK